MTQPWKGGAHRSRTLRAVPSPPKTLGQFTDHAALVASVAQTGHLHAMGEAVETLHYANEELRRYRSVRIDVAMMALGATGFALSGVFAGAWWPVAGVFILGLGAGAIWFARQSGVRPGRGKQLREAVRAAQIHYYKIQAQQLGGRRTS